MSTLTRRDCSRKKYSHHLLPIIGLMLWLLAYRGFAEEKNSGPTSEVQPLLIRLIINGITTDSTVIALRMNDREWWLPVNSLNRARVKLPDTVPLHFNDMEFVPISSMRVRDIQFEETTQTVNIQFDTTEFQMTRLLPTQAPPSDLVNAPSGFFVNYDLMLEHNPAGLRESAFADFAGAAGSGVLSSSHAYLRFDHEDRHLRLDTTYTIDRASERASWRLGDAISRPASLLGRPVRFGGLQYSTNFLTQPGLIITPMTTLGGQAALPSTVDVYVNNVFQHSRQIPPGPFSVSTAPVVTGDGEVALRVRDIAGREEVISQRFYASTALLSPGLADFSFEGGFLRRNFGRESNDYGDLFASASYRRGVTPTLTVEGHVQTQQGGATVVSGGLVKALAGLGTLSSAFAYSQDESRQGYQALAGLERRQGRHSIAMRSVWTSENFRQIGIDSELMTRRMDTLFWGYSLGPIGSLGLSYLHQQSSVNRATEIYTASFTTARQAWGTLVISAVQSRAETTQNSMYVLWVLPLEREISASLMHLRSQDRGEQTVFQINKSLTPEGSLGYRLQAAVNASQQATLFAQNQFVQTRLEAASLDDQTSARFGMAGAVARLDQQWFLTRRIGSSYGLVRMPGMRDVRIYVDNQFAARTDKAGYAFLPRLHPYVRNHVSIEPMDLPMDTVIEALTKRPIPAWRSGVVIDFPVRQQATATLTLHLSDGMPVPAGARIRIGGADTYAAVGRDGLVFVAGLEKSNQLDVVWGDRRCQATVPFSDPGELLPYLGTFVCKEVE